MKRQIIFNLDEDLVDELKRLENRSSFANRVLRNELDKEKMGKMSVEQLKELKEMLINKKELEDKIKKLENGN